MALQPSLKPLLIIGNPAAAHTLEVFLDYACPFSARMANKLNTFVRDIIDSRYPGKVKVIFRPHVQSWHVGSVITHEAGLAALRASPENYWPFSLALFKRQEEYFDIPTQDLTPRQIRENLAKLASEVLPPDAVEKFKELLVFKGTPNGGNAVTDDLKYTIKFSRQNGIHVSPSTLWDGLFQSQISSGWDEKEWSEFFAERISANE